MKKIIFLMLAMMVGVVSANAQTALEEAKILDNMYVGVGAGVATPLSLDKAVPLNPTFTLTIGKEFTPVFGMNVEGTAWFGSNSKRVWGEADGVRALIANRFDAPLNHPHNVFRGVNVGVNGTVNLTNLFLDYNGAPRNFEVTTVTGIGWGHVFVPGDGDMDNLTAKTALDFAFNLGAKKAHTVFVQPAVLWTLVGGQHTGVKFNKNDAQLAVSVGYRFHFKTSNGTHAFKQYDVGAMNDEINRLNAELAKKPREVIVKEDRIIEKIVPSVTEVTVNFEQGKSELLPDAKNTLDKIIENSVVEVVATASPEGTKEFNDALSQSRADVVAEYLTNRGVKVASKNGLGVTGKNSQRVARVILK